LTSTSQVILCWLTTSSPEPFTVSQGQLCMHSLLCYCDAAHVAVTQCCPMLLLLLSAAAPDSAQTNTALCFFFGGFSCFLLGNPDDPEHKSGCPCMNNSINPHFVTAVLHSPAAAERPRKIQLGGVPCSAPPSCFSPCHIYTPPTYKNYNSRRTSNCSVVCDTGSAALVTAKDGCKPHAFQ